MKEQPAKQSVLEELQSRAKKSDTNIAYMILGLWLFGVLISIHYDTWKLGLVMGSSLAMAYLIAYRLFRGKLFSRMVGASVMALYMVQYLAQLKGLYEMHFWFFIMPMFLIFYQDWRVFVQISGTPL